MKNLTKTALALGISAAFVAPLASAGTVSIDVSGIESWDGFGSANNTTMSIDLAAALGMAPGSSVTVTGIGWDVTLDTVIGTSWLSEIGVALEATIGFAPGAPDQTCDGVTVFCPSSYSSGGILDFTDAFTTVVPDLVLTDGILDLEFYESYDDLGDAIDGIWVSGTLSFATEMAPVPLPAAFPLLLTGLAGLFAARRRRVS